MGQRVLRCERSQDNSYLVGLVERLMDNSGRNQELLACMQLNDFSANENRHSPALHAKTLGESRMYMGRRPGRVWMQGQLRPDQPLLALNDLLRKSFGAAVEDLADLWNELQSRLDFGEYDAIQERSDHNEDNDDDHKPQ
jgi:hypothetical protein